MMTKVILPVAAALALLVPGGPGAAQDPLSLEGDRSLVDRVAAVVGDSVILVTEVEERIFQLRASGAQLPTDPGALSRVRRDILETLINEQLVIQAAVRDTAISVPDDRVEEAVEEDLQQRISQFESQSQFQEALAQAGLTLSSLRANLRNQARRQLLSEQFLARARGEATGIAVTEAEMRDFFESQRGSLQDRPATVGFAQVVVEPEPTDSARSAARAEAQRILGMIRAEEQDFETLARRFSQDPGTRQQGGDLGWFRRGDMVPEFEDVVFTLGNGQVSPVVETPFGFHVIKLERTRGSERKARHILIQPEVTDSDLEEARQRAGAIADSLRAGAPIRPFQEAHNDPDTPDTLSIALDRIQELPPGYGEALRGAEEGQILGPVEWQGAGNRTNYAVLEVREVREAGAFTFEDVRDQVEQTLRRQKLQERVLENLRRQTYVEIRL